MAPFYSSSSLEDAYRANALRAEMDEPVVAAVEALEDVTTPDQVAPGSLVSRERESTAVSKTQDLVAALAFALRSFKNLNQVLELTAFVGSQLTDADGGALVLFEPNGKVRLEQVHCADGERREQIRVSLERTTQSFSSQMVGEESPSPPGSLDWPSQETQAFAAEVEHFLDRLLQQDLGSQVYLQGTPLLLRNTVRGRLYVFSYQPGYAWNENRQKLLRLVADQASVAIENDELTVSLRRKVALDRELEIGSEIQSRLLPRHFPHLAGLQLAARCQSASQVGGDYYDFIEIKPESGSSRLGIVIGDVMGKGVPAGLLMTTMRGMLRAEVLNDHRPARILQHLNRVMYTDLEQSNRFISLFYSDYDPASGCLCFSNAAHNPTLHWQAATQELGYLDTPGQLIGLEAEGQFDEQCIRLQPGDVVVYYTDGFTEAANPHGERMESTGLESAVRYAASHFQDPQAILDSLFDQVEQFRQTARSRRQSASPLWSSLTEDELRLLPKLSRFGERLMAADDMTMVVIKVATDTRLP